MNILEARRRLLGRNVYKRTTEGNPAIAQGSLARMYPGITMQGWTKQDGTPTPEAPVPIVSAGTHNQETGKWEYEITIANEQTDPDKNQTVTLTSDRPLTKWDRLIKKDGVWGWEYGSDEYIAPKTGYRMFNRLESATGVYFLYTIWDDIGIEISVLQNQFCNYFKLENPYAFKGNAFWIVKLNEINKPVLRIGLSDENIDTVEEFEQFLSALDDIKILYKKANTEFVPLSSEEQEAMNSLYTFRPTTVLSNDCKCEMTLTYKTKKSFEVIT